MQLAGSGNPPLVDTAVAEKVAKTKALGGQIRPAVIAIEGSDKATYDR